MEGENVCRMYVSTMIQYTVMLYGGRFDVFLVSQLHGQKGYLLVTGRRHDICRYVVYVLLKIELIEGFLGNISLLFWFLAFGTSKTDFYHIKWRKLTRNGFLSFLCLSTT